MSIEPTPGGTCGNRPAIQRRRRENIVSHCAEVGFPQAYVDVHRFARFDSDIWLKVHSHSMDDDGDLIRPCG